mmetsp:Transcript_16749/g.29335  ORF Transcript_16749/g.29335 Transcript_16749/m.29335 type:complete len:202 (-) Transcript_16749:422-1027(-)
MAVAGTNRLASLHGPPHQASREPRLDPHRMGNLVVAHQHAGKAADLVLANMNAEHRNNSEELHHRDDRHGIRPHLRLVEIRLVFRMEGNHLRWDSCHVDEDLAFRLDIPGLDHSVAGAAGDRRTCRPSHRAMSDPADVAVADDNHTRAPHLQPWTYLHLERLQHLAYPYHHLGILPNRPWMDQARNDPAQYRGAVDPAQMP